MSKPLLQVLNEQVTLQPNEKVWTFLDDRGEISDSYTYKELDRTASSLASFLLNSCKLKAGDRALLVFFPGLSFMASLIACFKAGIIAIPVFPPDPRRLQKDLHHFISIQNSSGAAVVLTHGLYNFAKKVSDIQSVFKSKSLKWPELRWITVDDVLSRGKEKAASGDSGPALPPPPKRDDIAFLQYTSGSTSEPKGVMISHGNLGHNLTLIIKELKADKTTVNVSWLPQYHDMGLIGSYLGALYCGGKGYYLSPISFLKDPNVWLKSISRFKGTHTQAPNFAYALASRKFKSAVKDGSMKKKQLLEFNLKSVVHMINAAEPVDQVAIANFYETFRPYGLSSGVVIPTYGLAEHTVFVCSGGSTILTLAKSAFDNKVVEILSSAVLGESGATNGTANASSVRATTVKSKDSECEQIIVGCGFPSRGEGVLLAIVDPDTRKDLGENKIGEIWVSSPSKACGYWNLPDLTAQDFHAKIETEATRSSSSGAEKEYLSTGDLGFLHKGELYICGRSKDLIIVRGSNHYPQDIERTAERSEPSLRAGCSAAFSVPHAEGHTEAVVYVAEVLDTIQASPKILEDIAKNCRRCVAAEHGVMLSCVILLKTRTIPKTTSGKIARSWCRRGYLDGSLSVLSRWDAATDEGQGDEEFLGQEAVGNIELVGPSDSSIRDHRPSQLQPDTAGPPSRQSQLEVRALSVDEIVYKLEITLKQIASQSPAPITGKVDKTASLSSLGLDSFTLVQFKGVLEKRFYCDIPDEFLFMPKVNLLDIAKAVKIGGLTPAQKAQLEQGAMAGAPGTNSGTGSGSGPSTVIVQRKEPLCPWFTCCY